MFKVFNRKKTAEEQAPDLEPENVEIPIEKEAPAPVEVAVPESAAAATENSAKREEDLGLFISFLAGLYDGILIIDPKGYLLKSNERARELFNCSEDDLWGINCSELIPKLNAQVLYKIRAQIEERRFTVVSAICKRMDQTEFPAEIAISRITMNNDINMVLSIRNSERRSKEFQKNKLRDNAVKYAGVGIISCDPSGIIEYANRAFLRIVNAENEKSVLQRSIADFCLNADKLKEMLESPLPEADWYGSLRLKTLSDVEIKVQVTSSLSEASDSADKKPNVIITMTLIPTAAVSVA